MKHFNLILGLFWLLLGGAILVWRFVDPERNARMGGLNMTFLGIGALALAIYNGARWWLLRPRPRPETDWLGRTFPPRQPPKVVEYDPDLDFTKPEPTADADPRRQHEDR
ncbi:MAG: hypothetical protein U0793_08725 [Gemmataceae bacterium]